ncbi:YraN family protein [Candidatus Parcubacteria bacterium]|nr:YraN family protein [Patescibacteria group bacterium]MCG2694000.1 YraN family protein [Candidatus Parcubacteria bacterium]
MTYARKSLGRLGEELAVSFLKKKGYKILETNFVIKGFGEIDIICKKKDKIVFVEVRTKSSLRYGTPEESITPKKQQKLINLAHLYLNIKKWHYKKFAIDGVFVEKKDGEYEIRHLENMLECD